MFRIGLLDILQGMMAVFAQLERETIVERVKLAKKESARQGRFMGGPAPYGYRYDNSSKTLQVNEIPAQTVKWIYEQYLKSGRGYQRIAEKLEESGVPGPTGIRWTKNCVRKILTNPIYAGLVGHKVTLYPGKHEPIIEPEKWHEVQSLIRDRGAARAATAVHTGLLSGIIWCAECGARMRVKNWQNYPCTDPKKVIRYYVCYKKRSNIDLLIGYPPESNITLFTLVDLGDELKKALNKKVDLVTENGISPKIKTNALKDKYVIL